MSALRRTAIGGFRADDSLALDELSHDSLRGQMQSPLAAVADLPRVAVSAADVVEIRHGRPIKLQRPEIAVANPLPSEAALTAECASLDEWAAIDTDGRLVAILRQKNTGELWPEINFDIEDGTGNS
jgi:tRNA U55 pseudouridine synthase TruB